MLYIIPGIFVAGLLFMFIDMVGNRRQIARDIKHWKDNDRS